MCFGGGGGGVDNTGVYQAQREAEEARKREEERQARIQQGRTLVNTIFGGGTTDIMSRAGTVNPAWEEWNNAVRAFSDMMGADVSQSDIIVTREADGSQFSLNARAAPAQYLPGQEPVYDSRTFAGFTDDYFNNIRQSNINYYTGQLADQYRVSRENTAYDLARAGLSGSTVASRAYEDIQRANDTEAGNIAVRAEQTVSDQREAVNRQRASVLAQLEASSDPAGAANLATAASAQLRTAPVQYNPLGDIFGTVAQGIGAYATGARQQQFMDAFNRASSGSGTTAGSGRVVR